MTPHCGEDAMDTIPVDLTRDEIESLDQQWPKSKGHGAIERRAVEIVRIYLRRKDPGCKFESANPGADLKVVFSRDSLPVSIEVKGTASRGLAWNQIKVSSPESC